MVHLEAAAVDKKPKFARHDSVLMSDLDARKEEDMLPVLAALDNAVVVRQRTDCERPCDFYKDCFDTQ